MTPEQFLPLAEIKTKCGITGADLDAQLITYRLAAIGVVETRTRRNIRDREGERIRALEPKGPRGFITFFVYDAKPIEAAKIVRYRTLQDDPGFDRDGQLAIPDKFWEVRPDSVRAYNADSSGLQSWPERRDRSIPFEANLDVGIPDGEAPAEFKAAALMLVREMQEGSPLDALPHSILDLVLADHVKPALTAADETLYEAGIQ